jgi:hypothetical protein
MAGASMADRDHVGPSYPDATAAAYLDERAEAARPAARSALRTLAPPPTAPLPPAAAPATAATPPAPRLALAATPEASPIPAPSRPPIQAAAVGSRTVAPVAGLSQLQMDHAATIVAMGQRAGLPEYAYVIAIATAMQETMLRNLANPTVPESLNHPNDGTGTDHDSVGLFQQRPSTGWGTVAQIMDPSYSATKFYDALQRVSGWENLAVTVAAQRVQRSAFPEAYAKHEPRARQIVDALT